MVTPIKKGIVKTGYAAAETMADLGIHLLEGARDYYAARSQDSPVDIRQIMNGDMNPETFSPPFEEGGRSRFLPALAIAAASVKDDKEIGPREMFDSFSEHLNKKNRNVTRSEKTESTRHTVKRLLEGSLDVISGIEIIECPSPTESPAARLAEAEIPANGRGVVLAPFSWGVFRELQEIHEDLHTVPAWGVVTGAAIIAGHNQRGELLTSPDHIVYRTAFPVRPLGERNDDGIVLDMPGELFTDFFMRPTAIDGGDNVAYQVRPAA